MNQINNGSNDILIISDEQILSLSKDIFKVGRFKELLIRECREKLSIKLKKDEKYNQVSILQMFKQLNVAEDLLDIEQIKFEFFKDCNLLNIDSQKWEAGTIKVNIHISLTSKNRDQVDIHFYPQEKEHKPPLDNSQNGHALMVSSRYN